MYPCIRENMQHMSLIRRPIQYSILVFNYQFCLQTNTWTCYTYHHWWFSSPNVMAAVIFTEKCMEIKPVKELWKIKARVTTVWDAILLGSGEQMSLDMIHIVYYHYNAHRLLPIYMLMMIKKIGGPRCMVLLIRPIWKNSNHSSEGKVYITANVKCMTTA